jgi:hypothetical protein
MPRVEAERIASLSFVPDEQRSRFQFQIGNVNPLVVFLTLPPIRVYTEDARRPQFFTGEDFGCGYPGVSAVSMR